MKVVPIIIIMSFYYMVYFSKDEVYLTTTLTLLNNFAFSFQLGLAVTFKLFKIRNLRLKYITRHIVTLGSDSMNCAFTGKPTVCETELTE